MDLSLSPELEADREQVKKWFAANLPEGWNTPEFKELSDSELTAFGRKWERKLYEGGYNGINWPKEYGGQGLTNVHQTIFYEEAGKVQSPGEINTIGKSLLGPTLLALGTEEQKQRYLPAILKGDEIWCQGFSEPNAGSDMASLKTSAVLDGDDWVINGQKVWTSGAKNADWCFVLARTDQQAPKHKGITFFLVPMTSEGITVRPIIQIDGKGRFCEVFFDNVRIPKDQYVGQLNTGWQVAMTLLSFERGTMSLGRQAEFQREFNHLVKLTGEIKLSNNQLVKDNPYFRQKLAGIYSEIRIFRYHALRTVSQLLNEGKLGPEASLQKLFWSSMHVKLGELAMEVLGDLAPYWGNDSVGRGVMQKIDLGARGETIYAGTSQIQKNILAERVLGMPR